MIGAVALLLPGIRESAQLVPASALVFLGFPATVVVYFFPWHRYHVNWFLAVGISACLHLGLFVAVTGGESSPFWPFVLFVVLGSASYFRDRWPIVVLTLLSLTVIVSPLAYTNPANVSFVGSVVIRGFVVTLSFIIGRWLFRATEQSALRINRLEQSRADFLFSVAHQIKTPLSSLRGSLDLLARDASAQSSTDRKLFDAASRSEQRIEEQVERLLQLFQTPADESGLRLAPNSVADLADSAAALIRSPIGGKHQSLVVDLPANLPLVHADAERIESVIHALLSNAVEFSPPGGNITLQGRETAGMVAVRVTDMGPGVPATDRNHVFEPFYQVAGTPAADSRGTRAGLGMGLAVARSVVQLHGGHIWIEDAPGGGATFCFTLPVTAERSA